MGSIDEARDWLRLAEETLGAAQALQQAGFRRDATSRAYYAMFYAARAALATEGQRVTKHTAVISVFGRIFAKTGRIAPELHRALIDAFEEREAADYEPSWAGDADDASKALARAAHFVRTIRTMLDQSHGLSE